MRCVGGADVRKKSTSGSKTPQSEVEKVGKRLKEAESHYAERQERQNGKGGTEPRVEAGSGNLFADWGFANPDLAPAKAELVQRIRELIDARELTQAGAAELLGLDQPKVSALVRGRVAGYSLDRLFRFLNALGQRVEIHVTAGGGAAAGAERAIVVTR